MTQNLTEWLQTSRFTVVSFDPPSGRLRLKGAAEACSDVACSGETAVVTDEGDTAGLEALNPGDIVRIESTPGREQRIVVLRRVWDELTSPEV